MVRLETPYRDFLAFWERAADADRDEQVALWDELYESRHRDLLALYRRVFDAPLEDALDRYGTVAAEIEERLAALDVERVAPAVQDLFGVREPVRVVAFVGLFTANAWVHEQDGEPVVFLALEAETRERWHPMIAAHEVAHASHQQLRGEGFADDDVMVVLNAEGVALAATRRIAPEVPLEQHFDVPDYAAWEAECRAVWPWALPDLLTPRETPHPAALRRFFWPDWGREERDVPARFGYYAAAALTDALLDRHELAEVASWPTERAAVELRAVARTLA